MKFKSRSDSPVNYLFFNLAPWIFHLHIRSHVGV